ncbi:S8 family serine peptidase [Eubacterium sp.]|uniref:S8 family serine peptidase n=1 Tax=Eubacterium sp. TaxID=142586 RepID=UPI0025ED333A|nr:S8 family serine peptidase [Eubacterium sp.]MCR5628187.1 S8 family serine peptidase [Eubacterium sp.]
MNWQSKEDKKSSEVDIKKQVINYNIIDEKVINHWSLDNTKGNYAFSLDRNDWGGDNILSCSDIDINFIYDDGIKKRDAVIAVIDSGVDLREVCEENIWINNTEIGNDGLDNDKNGYIDDLHGWNLIDNTNEISSDDKEWDIHGNFVTSILSSKNKGISLLKNEKIMFIKVFNGEEMSCDIEMLLNAIDYAENNGAFVCNLSLNTFVNSYELKEKIKNSKMLFVVAAGNDAIKIDDEDCVYPMSYGLDNVIGVANLRRDGELSRLSNFGKGVDIAAPGTDIIGFLYDKKYGCISGTSCAVPFVSATAIKIYSEFERELTAKEVKNIILDNSKENKKIDPYIKNGRMLDYGKVIRYINKYKNRGRR